jgi:hypothetical protein
LVLSFNRLVTSCTASSGISGYFAQGVFTGKLKAKDRVILRPLELTKVTLAMKNLEGCPLDREELLSGLIRAMA